MNSLTFLARSDIPSYDAPYDHKRIVGYGTIQLTSGGELYLAYDDEKYDLTAEPTFWPAYAGVRLRFGQKRRGDSWHHRHIAFTGPRVQAWEASGIWPFAPIVSPSQEEAFLRVLDLSQGTKLQAMRAANILESILIEFAEMRTLPKDKGPEWFMTVLERLSQNPFPDYQQLADEVGMGESTLRRKFQSLMGKSMHHHVIETRILEIRRRLADTDASLREIAEELGYPNEFYLSRQFKQWTGVSPGTYRKSR
jgi:AraC-like DNA-binding protein